MRRMWWAGPFVPQLFVERVVQLDVSRLRALGLTALLLDVDCTLKRYREERLNAEVADWLKTLQTAGIKVCLVSNGRGPRIARLAGAVGLPFVAKALKPFPFGCWRGLRTLGVSPQQTAMVGDQIFADVAAGRWAGLTTVLVRPIHPEDEPWFTRLKRPVERWLLRRMRPQWDAEQGGVEE